ncbi:MAG: hypothetical protein LBQ14_00140, partial [Treponema sp.]|nr:hypothetical protein [Treponema sp.]
SVIYGNTAQGGGAAGIYNVAYDPSTPVISYSLVQGSGGSGSWDPEAGTDGGNNLDEDPKFVNPDPASSGSPKTGGSYLLTVENVGTIYEIVSPAVNAGDNNSYPNTWAKWEALTGAGGISTEEKYNTYIAPHIGNDLDDHIRIQNPAEGGIIDMGAYENG